MVNLFWILRFGKNSGLNYLETENKNEVKYERKFLEASGY